MGLWSSGSAMGPTIIAGVLPVRSSDLPPLRLAPGVRLDRLPELDEVAPMDAAERFRDLPGLAVLESARPGRNARWSYVTADPVTVLEAPADGPDPFATARRVLARLAVDPIEIPGAPPFDGGLVGYLGYDLGRRLERLPSIALAAQELPLLRLALHDWVLALDRRDGSAWLAGRALGGRIDRPGPRLADVRRRRGPQTGSDRGRGRSSGPAGASQGSRQRRRPRS